MVLNDVGLCYGVCKILRQMRDEGLMFEGVSMAVHNEVAC